MSSLFAITLIGAIAGIAGTSLGGLIANIFYKPSNKILSFILAFSGGVMLAVIFNDLIPESLEYGNITTMLFGMLTGIVFILLLDYLIPHKHVSSEDDLGSRRSSFVRSSLLLGIGIAMHNFPEGLAIGASYIASTQLGFRLAIIIAFHNIPEGMAMGGPMKAANLSTRNVLLGTALAGLPMGVGAYVGGLLGGVSGSILSSLLGFAAGAMLYLVFDELLPTSQQIEKGHSSTYGAVTGVVFGLIFLLLMP